MAANGQISGGDLLMLQGQIKRDAEGYHEEFMQQYKHYRAQLAVFNLKPSAESKEFGDLVMFLAQVTNCYKKDLEGFPGEVMELLNKHSPILDHSLRKTLAQSLILLRNRGVVEPQTLFPLFFHLFRCPDKSLRQLLFSHMVHDIAAMNRKHREDRLNRFMQNFLYNMVQDENEVAAKKSLAVLIELHRRQVWQDARTVNVIASACQHKSTRILVAVLKFFLGTDQANDQGSDSESEEDDEPAAKIVALNREQVYKATKKGTGSSKKKKQAKLKRVMQSLKKQQKKDGQHQVAFGALQLLHDPQGFAEKLFGRLRASNDKFEVKLMMMNVISRVIGVHKLLLLNFYPYLQRYVYPHQRDATHLLACAAQACHDEVPPDAVEPLLRQLVNQFVHDRARPEVMAVGLRTTREMCARMPLLMSAELLQDLALYKKSRDKPVASAARALITLFRDLAPSLLEKKDRGKGADLTAKLPAYGEQHIAENVPGAELLAQANQEEDESAGSDAESADPNDDSAGPDAKAADAGGESARPLEDDEEEAEEEAGPSEDASDGDSEEVLSDMGADSDSESVEEGGTEGGDMEEGANGQDKRAQVEPKADSLRSLKRAAKAVAEKQVVLGEDGFLSNEDFKRIRELQSQQVAEAAMLKHGLKRKSSEGRVNPEDLEVSLKKRKMKEERLASVMAGREDRGQFGAATGRKKTKQGGSSNREKQKKKNLPLAALRDKSRKRLESKPKGKVRRNKVQLGRKAWQR